MKMVAQFRFNMALIGVTALLMPGVAGACDLHWALGLQEPVGIWPTAQTDAATALTQLQLQDAADDAALTTIVGGRSAPSTPQAAPALDPSVTSWMINTTGRFGRSNNPVVNSVVSKIQADVQTVAYTDTNVYIKATGIPSHLLGSYGANPAIPSNVNRTVDIPRTPVVKMGAKTPVGNGNIGVAINGATFYNASDAMSYQNQNVWHQNANVFEASGFDGGPGHPSPIMGQTVTTSVGTAIAGNYHYHQAPIALVEQVDPGNTGQHASPVIGFAFDGFPIFGSYGYANPDGTGGVVLMSSSYQPRNITTRTTLPNGAPAASAGPDVSATYPIGSYIEDYAYVAGSGTLDQYNGRFAVAPGYPNGTYGYYVTRTAAGQATYPYVVGPQYNGVVQTDNLGGGTITVPTNATFFTPAVPEPSACLILLGGAMGSLLRRRVK